MSWAAAEVGRRLRLLRESAGLRQLDVADGCVVSQHQVSRWERGEAMPDLWELLRLASLFGLEVTELVAALLEDEEE